uniref:Ig-like domain-containing protein n=1 Tax=Mola mola TaxID=94237 RepID=A0A3Q3WRN5_MOLML
MESGFLTFFFVSSFTVPTSNAGWDDFVVAREGMTTILSCTDERRKGAVTINWMMKAIGADEWKLVLSANERKEISGSASKMSMQFTDVNFKDTGVFSLSFLPKVKDSGFYSCLIKKEDVKERIILLAILTVTVVPAAPIPQLSTLELIASVNPDYAVDKIIWAAPGAGRVSMKSKKSKTGTVAKLPQVQSSDSGSYACMIHPLGNSSTNVFTFSVNITVDANSVASFPNKTYGSLISTATQAQASITITCPEVPGDYVRLYWLSPDARRQRNMTRLYHYDRWRGSTLVTEQSKRLQLAGPPYNAETGSFSFLLTPELKHGGLYECAVFLNDHVYSQRTLLSVMKVKTSHSSSKLELGCLYSERSQVQSAKWKYQDESHQLHMSSNSPGSITTVLTRPITSDTAGNYTCTLQLKNGKTIWATQAVTLPTEALTSSGVVVMNLPPPPPSLHAIIVSVSLHSGIEQSLSFRSGEAENIYENPEDIRQAPPAGSVYMDLKPRGEDDVYKELEQFEQCQS